jgi:hypothetical protein
MNSISSNSPAKDETTMTDMSQRLGRVRTRVVVAGFAVDADDLGDGRFQLKANVGDGACFKSGDVCVRHEKYGWMSMMRLIHSPQPRSPEPEQNHPPRAG